MTPEERAQKSAAAMIANDAASRGMGIHLIKVGPGHATMTMTVRDDMVNGHAVCHGGYIFSLADSAMAFASNSYNQVTLAQQNQISFVSPAKAGEDLTAKATEAARPGRSGIYDVIVTANDGRTVALMRSMTRTIKGQTFEEKDDQ